jgi:hypothetical protein
VVIWYSSDPGCSLALRLDGFFSGDPFYLLDAVGAVSFFRQLAGRHIMNYSPLHPIQKFKNTKLTQVPALFVKTSPQTATRIGFAFLVITWHWPFFWVSCPFGLVYLIPWGNGVITLMICYPFVLESENFGKSF